MKFLKEKNNENLDIPQTSLLHREIVLRKKFLKKLYSEWYKTFISEIKEQEIIILQIFLESACYQLKF